MCLCAQFSRSKPPEARSNVLRCAVASCRKEFHSVSDFNAHTQNAHNMALPSRADGGNPPPHAATTQGHGTAVKIENPAVGTYVSKCNSVSASVGDECDCCGPADNRDMSDDFETRESSTSFTCRSPVPPLASILPHKRSRASSAAGAPTARLPTTQGRLVVGNPGSVSSSSKRAKFDDRNLSGQHSEFRGMAPLAEILPAPLFANQATYTPGHGSRDTPTSYKNVAPRSTGAGPPTSSLPSMPMPQGASSFPKSSTLLASRSPKPSANRSPSGPRARVVGSTSNPLLEATSRGVINSKRMRLVGMTTPPADDEDMPMLPGPIPMGSHTTGCSVSARMESPSVSHSLAPVQHVPTSSPMIGLTHGFSPRMDQSTMHSHTQSGTSFAQHEPVVKLEKLPAAASLSSSSAGFGGHTPSSSFHGRLPSALPPPLPLYTPSSLPLPRPRLPSAIDFDLSNPNLAKF